MSARTFCTQPECGKKEHARGLCVTHYQKLLSPRPPCVVADCDRPKSTRDGLCRMHGKWLRQRGTVEPPTRPTTCAVEDCTAERHGVRTLCREHYLLHRRTGTTDPAEGFAERIITEFQQTVVRGREDECWEWPGARQQGTDGRPAYGVVANGAYAHRVSQHIHHGPIPPGAFVLHACDNPPCVNPAHLRAGSRVDNAQDAVLRGRHFTPFARRTHV